MSYYYFAASLPVISMDTAPDLTLDEFREQCELHLTDRHRAAVENLLDDSPDEAPCTFTLQWRSRETQLRNAIARHRASRRNQDVGPYLKDHDGFEADVDDEVDTAFASPTPLDRELAFERLRWNAIEEIEGLDEFSIDAILGYALKLRIAHRWAAMDEESGQSRADELINQELANE